MSWFFYSKEGKLLYDVASGGAVGDAATLDGIDSTGFVQQGTPPAVSTEGVQLQGSFYLPVTTISANTVLTYLGVNDAYKYRTIVIDTSGGPVTLTLPDPPNTSQIYEIKNSGTGIATIDALTKNIDTSGTSITLTAQHQAVTLVYDGTRWRKISQFTSTGSTDADTLDTLDSTQFLRSDVDDTAAGNITFSKSIYSPVTSVTSTTLTDSHKTVLVDSTAAIRTITLPLAPVTGQWYEIKDKFGTAGTNKIVIDPNGGTIDGSGANQEMTTNFDIMVLVYSGAGWFIVSHRYGSSLTADLDDLGDVTILTPLEGQLLRYDTPANEWKNTALATIDDSGQVHIPANSLSGGISLGDLAGVGNEAFIAWQADKTMRFTGRTVHFGTINNRLTLLQNGIVPSGDTYDVDLPTDNQLLCFMTSGDIFIRLPDTLNPFPATNGDVISAKDIDGFAGTNTLAFVGEGVRRRNVPILSATSITGTIADTTTTSTPGGIGVDEIQSFSVTGVGTFKVTFDGQEATAVLTNASIGSALVTAINSLSPHPNYGYFSVSTTTPAALVTAGVPITFDGGSMIDGEAYFYLANPYQSSSAISYDGNWYLT